MSEELINYRHNYIRRIYEQLEEALENQGKHKPHVEVWSDQKYFSTPPAERFYPVYSPEVVKRLEDAISFLKISFVYSKSIHSFLMEHTSEDEFLKELDASLAEINDILVP